MRQSVAESVERVLVLYQQETVFREAARGWELTPAGDTNARRLFEHASALRSERLEVLRTAGLL